MKNLILTIDDAPSTHMDKKCAFLLHHSIPAIFYCRGEFIPSKEDSLVKAIEKGFLIGNHSFSHTSFQKLSFQEIVNEITQTEELIDRCYQKADLQRPLKTIRFPFGEPSQDKENLHLFLQAQGFQRLSCSTQPIDTSWTIDTLDYKKKSKVNLALLEKQLQKNHAPHIVLMHDFSFSHHVFEPTIRFFLQQGCHFLDAIPYFENVQ